MRFQGYAGSTLNSPDAQELATGIGRFVMNFGCVELLTYHLIGQLDDDAGTHYESSLDLRIGNRFEKIESLVHQHKLSVEVVNDVRILKKCAKRLADFRNIVAHSPVVRYWKGKAAVEGVGIICLIDIKSQKGRETRSSDVITVDGLGSATDAVAELAANLESVISDVERELADRD